MRAYALDVNENGSIVATEGEMSIDPGTVSPAWSPGVSWHPTNITLSRIFLDILRSTIREHGSRRPDRRDIPEGEPPWGLRTMFVYNGCRNIDPYADSIDRLYDHRLCLWNPNGGGAMAERSNGLRAERRMLESENLWFKKKEWFFLRLQKQWDDSREWNIPFVTDSVVYDYGDS